MQHSETVSINQNETIESKRDHLAEKIAFLIVQSHRRDQQQLEKSAETNPNLDR